MNMDKLMLGKLIESVSDEGVEAPPEMIEGVEETSDSPIKVALVNLIEELDTLSGEQVAEKLRRIANEISSEDEDGAVSEEDEDDAEISSTVGGIISELLNEQGE